MNRDWLQLPDTAGDIPPRRHHRRLTLAVLLGAAFLAGSLCGRALASTPRSTMTAIPTPDAAESGSTPAGSRNLSWSTEASPAHSLGLPELPRLTMAADGDGAIGTRFDSARPRTAAAIVSGTASWFATGPDGLYAAAGPALRRMLGPHWRGRYVTVSAGGRSIRVRITDWCGCPGGRLIDLADEAFARLSALSRGLVRVTVA